MMKLLLLLFAILYVCSAEICTYTRTLDIKPIGDGDFNLASNVDTCEAACTADSTCKATHFKGVCFLSTQTVTVAELGATHSLKSCSQEESNGAVTGYATCDNDMSFYVDGVLKAYKERDWFRASSVAFPDTTLSVAIKCFDRGVIGGIKAAFDNNVRTDGSWKCSNTFQEGWNAWNFDDSSWEDATIQTHTQWGNSPRELNDGVTKWIWTQGDKQDRTVYCRKRFNTDSCDASSLRYVRDLNNCHNFRQCVHGEFVSMQCAPGTGFNEALQTCDHLANLPNCN